MIRYAKKFRFFSIYENWFGYEKGPGGPLGLYAVFHQKTPGRITGIQEDNHTYEIDLTRDWDTIFARINKNFRQDVRKAAETGIVIHPTKDLNRFVDFFNEFARLKCTFGTSLHRMEEKGSKLECFVAVKDGIWLAAHSYLVDADLKMVRHYQTATVRFDERFDSIVVGRANKFALVSALQQYKDRGFTTFDLGGCVPDTKEKDIAGINVYKSRFGGELVVCKDTYSYLYWIMKKISKLLGNKSGTV